MTTLAFRVGCGALEWSETELVARMLLRGGDAWREFHRRYDRLIYRCIHKVTSRFAHMLSNEDTSEIYAQLMLDLTQRDMHKLRCFDAARGNKLSTWIGMLATHAAWDHLRSQSRQPASATLEAADTATCNADPFEDFQKKERWNQVNETLSTFSTRDREFVRLFYVHGMSPEEVASQMRISVKTVYSKKHKIRCRLERLLETLAA